MEYKELEILWKQYDERLDKLEEINRKLLNETLLQKPQKKLRRLELNIVLSLIAPLFVFIFFRHNFKIENIEWNCILGWTLLLICILFLFIRNLIFYVIFKKINLSSDTVIQSLGKITKLKMASNNFQKHFFLCFPIIFLGLILIAWNNIDFNVSVIVVLCISFIAIYYVAAMNAGSHYNEKIGELEKDIIELKKYTEE